MNILEVVSESYNKTCLLIHEVDKLTGKNIVTQPDDLGQYLSLFK